MKVRAQEAKPCEKKGDKVRGSSFCECMASCKKEKGYLRLTSAGTLQYLRSQTSVFLGCLPLEETLIQDHLIRYESREVGGLEVLFEGVESAQNLNAEIFNDDGTATQIESFLNSAPDLLTDSLDNDRNLKKATSLDQGIRDYLPNALGFAQAGTSAFMACAPPNLEESFFETMYARGDFDQEHEDIQNLAACFYHRVDLPSEMKKIWPRYTEKRYQAAKNSIWAKVQKKMPPWAKKFYRIWDKLSESQSEALKLEWFYEEVEKPTQEENAKKVGISIASYQERLGWAYKKLDGLYPEFTRRRRKNPNFDKPQQTPEPLYEILPSGEKVQIEHPAKQDKILNTRERHEILKWAHDSTAITLFRYDQYTDVDDVISEEKEESEEDDIEQEHQDHMHLKAEESELKQKAGLLGQL